MITRRGAGARAAAGRAASSSGPIDEGRFVPGDMLAERYRVVGRGGMGEVCRADDLEQGLLEEWRLAASPELLAERLAVSGN